MQNTSRLLNVFFQLRNAIKIVAIIIAVATYHYVFDYKTEAGSFISLITADPIQYNFYSGSPGGFYIKIGDYLENATKEKRKKIGESYFQIEAISTAGGVENLKNVLTHTNSFGLANEITSPPDDYARTQANFITPLYMERLHIFYRKDAFRKSVLNYNKSNNYLPENSKTQDIKSLKPVLKINADIYTKVFLNEARINGGPHGSGTRLLTSFFLNSINDYEPKSIFSYNNKEVKMHLTEVKDVDIFFSVVGDPIVWFTDLSRDTAYGMISIDPALIEKVNSTYNLNLQYADFKDKYKFEDVNEVTTMGSYVNLVASPDVGVNAIIDVLTIIEEAKVGLKTGQQVEEGIIFQLEEKSFINHIKKLEAEKTSLLQSFLLFLLTVSISTMSIIWFLVTVISRSKISKYYRTITSIYQDHFTFKYQLSNRKNNIASPIIDHKPKE